MKVLRLRANFVTTPDAAVAAPFPAWLRAVHETEEGVQVPMN